MKKVLLHKFGTSPPRDENPLLKLRRPVFKSKSRTFKSLSISSRDIAGVGALLALSPTCAVAAANRKKGKAGRGGGGTHSNSTTSSDESGQHSRPHSPLVNLSSSPIVSTINKKPKRTVKKKRSSSFTKPRSRNSVKLLVDEATGKRNKHLSACHRCGNVRKEKVLCKRCIHCYCVRCHERMSSFYGPDAFKGGCPMCKRLCCCGENRSINCSRDVHCYKKCPAAKDAANFNKSSKVLFYSMGQGAREGGRGDLLQMSPGRRRAQSELIRPMHRNYHLSMSGGSLPPWYDPVLLAKTRQEMEANNEVELPSSVTGLIGAYTLEERRKKLERYLAKRSRRVWDRNVRYQCRKNIAVNRLRVRGRFISREEEESLLNAGFTTTSDDMDEVVKAVAFIEQRRKERSMSSIN
jgi:hypothetical protein